ncbi:MAG: cyclic nucleotide-binding domain-containing protein [Pirellulaceae bacterium]
MISKPKRWDEPFDPTMTSALVENLLGIPPFSAMDEASFESRLPLRGILQNDCRLFHFEKGDIIMRQGEYGGSVFLLLDGELTAALSGLPQSLLGRSETQKSSWWKSIATILRPGDGIERRRLRTDQHLGQRSTQEATRIFVQDVPAVLSGCRTEIIQSGQLFGEVSALTRSPRTTTVIAASRGTVLEMRWQGFRDLIQNSPELKEFVNASYRKHSLATHLRETPILAGLSEQQIESVVAKTELISFGKMQWTSEHRSIAKADVAERILREPTIATQGEYVNGLILVRSGFARVTRRQGDGEQTIEYLGRGRHFGLRELAHNIRTGDQLPWQLSLRAVGYVDILMIPIPVFENSIFPNLATESLPSLFPRAADIATGKSRRQFQRRKSLDTKLMESLVETRLINGTQAMVIDLHRCTRCDDCVRACASAHDNNPRFVREGVTIDQWMFANACMHCLDPVCMIGCPTGAIARDTASGVVQINDQTCVGCQTCANSCPYNNIKMVAISDENGSPLVDTERGLPVLQATKCDLCINASTGPSCQRACPHDALVRIDLSTSTPLSQWIEG